MNRNELVKQKYSYQGPVTVFGKCILNDWHAETYAVTENKARSNFAYQFKNYYGRVPSSKVELPGEIKLIS